MPPNSFYRSCEPCFASGEVWQAPWYGRKCTCCNGEGGHSNTEACWPLKSAGRTRGYGTWRGTLPEDWIPPSPDESPAVAILDKVDAAARDEARKKIARRMVERRTMRMRGAFVEDIDRDLVWARDGGTCGICGEAADPDDWQLDHIHPLSRGGLHEYSNVQVSHPHCNRKKWAHIVTEVPITADNH